MFYAKIFHSNLLKCYRICHEFHDETTRLHFCFITLNEDLSMQNISRLYTLDSNEHFMHSGYEIIIPITLCML